MLYCRHFVRVLVLYCTGRYRYVYCTVPAWWYQYVIVRQTGKLCEYLTVKVRAYRYGTRDCLERLTDLDAVWTTTVAIDIFLKAAIRLQSCQRKWTIISLCTIPGIVIRRISQKFLWTSVRLDISSRCLFYRQKSQPNNSLDCYFTGIGDHFPFLKHFKEPLFIGQPVSNLSSPVHELLFSFIRQGLPSIKLSRDLGGSASLFGTSAGESFNQCCFQHLQVTRFRFVTQLFVVAITFRNG